MVSDAVATTSPPQRQHALELSDERGDRRCSRTTRARPLADFFNAVARRDRVRRQHDDAHVPPRARARPRLGCPATRSSSRSSIIMATSRRGGARARARRDASVGAHVAEDGDARLRRPRARDHAAHAAAGDRRRVERARHDHRRAPAPCSWRTRAGALVFVDAVHYAPHALMDVAAARLRFPGVLGVQVLRAARRRPLRRQRPARMRSTSRSSSPLQTTRRNASRPARRTTKASSGPLRPSSSWPA